MMWRGNNETKTYYNKQENKLMEEITRKDSCFIVSSDLYDKEKWAQKHGVQVQ